MKAYNIIMPAMVSEEFRETLQRRVKVEGRDASKLGRMLLRERYRDLPEE